MGTLKSDLIAKLGFSGGPGETGTLRIEYRSDGKVFDTGCVDTLTRPLT